MQPPSTSDQADDASSPDTDRVPDTERTRLEEADRLALLGTLAASVGHEINNPLTYVIANLSLVLEQLTPDVAEPSDQTAMTVDAEAIDYIREALEGAERVARVVEDMRALGQAGPQLEAQPTDVEATLDLAIRQTANQVRHRARLSKHFSGVAHVDGHSGRLCQVFVNLLLNAAQAIAPGQASRNEISVRTRQQGDSVLIEVSDTGSGIAEHVLPNIFEPFFTTKRVGEGTGLGLSICRNIVRSFSGEMEVSSTPGLGTTFRVTLPAAREQRLSERPIPPQPRPDVPRARILLIDDDPVVSKTMRRMLTQRHDVEFVSDAREALRRIVRGERFDLIVCDLMMPEMSGIALYAELVRRRSGSARRMMFVTGGAFTSEAQEFLQSIENARITKPFTPDSLRIAVDIELSKLPPRSSEPFSWPVAAALPPTHLSLSFPPEWDRLDVVRESCGFFARATYDDVIVGQRVGLVVHELIENAIRYSPPGQSRVEIDVESEREHFQVSVTNPSTGDHAERLLASVSELDIDDPKEAYLSAMRRSMSHPMSERGIGLARVAYEAEVKLKADFAHGRMRIVASGQP